MAVVDKQSVYFEGVYCHVAAGNSGKSLLS